MKPESFSEFRPHLYCYKLFITLLASLLIFADISAQTLVGSGQFYTTLKSAFDAINNGTLKGNIVLQITSSITETATASLNPSGSGGANYSSVTIYPTGSGYSISGNLANPIIQLNGADNVTIDGRVNQSGSRNLTISNSNTGSTQWTCAVLFINNAENNVIKYCTLKGSETGTNSGIICFKAGGTEPGNDNNTIEYCDISKEGSNGANNGIYSEGSSGGTINNSGIIIRYNNFYDILRLDAGYYGIKLEGWSTAWTIMGNSFFETVTRTRTSSVTDFFIYMGQNYVGGNFNISGNYIGGTEAQCGGSQLTIDANSTSYSMRGIYFYGCSDFNANSVQGNYIKNIAVRFSAASEIFTGIRMGYGIYNVGTTTANYIGSDTETGSIYLLGTSGAPISKGIYIAGSTITANISNNYISSITLANNTSSYSHSFMGINISSYEHASVFNINSNHIGSPETDIVSEPSATGQSQEMYGISSNGRGAVTISGNIIENLKNKGNGTNRNITHGIYMGNYPKYNINNNVIKNFTSMSGYNGSENTSVLGGIVISLDAYSFSDTLSINNNSIYNLTNTYTGNSSVQITGIYPNNNGSSTTVLKISGNSIYDLSQSSTSTAASIKGIHVTNTSGYQYYYNNAINLGRNLSKNCEIAGMYLAGRDKNVFINNNTVNVQGSGITSSSVNTYSLYYPSQPSTHYLDIRNNIFSNLRSNTSGTAKHYSISLFSVSRLTIDYNSYYFSGTVLGYIGADKTTLADWKAATLQDSYSVTGNPVYISDTNMLPDSTSMYCWNVYKKAMPLTLVNTDIRGLPRSTSVIGGPVCMGAYEFTTATQPDVAYQSGVPSSGGTSYYSQSNRRLFEITWGTSLNKPESGGKIKKSSGKKSSQKQEDRTLPSSVSLQYYSGQTPPDTANNPVAKIGKGYYYFDTDRDPANSISVKVYWGNHELGNITDTSKLILAMYDIKRKYWIPFYRGFSGNNVSIVDHSAKTLTVNGITRIDSVRFALTDNDYPLICVPLSAGDYSVGTSTRGYFPTITDAVSTIVFRGISGPVRLLLTDTLYSSGETFPLKIDSIPGSSADNTLTIKPYSNTSPVIQANYSGPLLDLNHCKYVIIDGSNNSGGRNMTLNNTATGGVTIRFIYDAGYNTVKNCIIIGSNASAGTIYFHNSSFVTGCDYNTVDNCTIKCGTSSANYSIFFQGSGDNFGDYNKITNNDILDYEWIAVYSENKYRNTEISNNNIYQQNISSLFNSTAIYLIGASAKVYNNKIHDLKCISSGNVITGIILSASGSTSDTTIIFNNIIYLDTTAQNPQITIYGVMIGNTSEYIKVLNNLVYIGGEGITAGGSQCVEFGGSSDRFSIFNNMFINKRSNGTGTSAHYIYKIDDTAGFSLSEINNNLCYLSGNGGIFGYDGTASRNTLSDWVTATGKDRSSLSSNPVFINSSLFLPDSTVSDCWNMYKKGLPVTSVSVDYRGLPRNTSILNGPVCIGPYEFTTTTLPPTATTSGSPVAGDTTFYTQAGRTLLSVLWGAGGMYKGNPNENKKQILNNNKSPKAGGFSWMLPREVTALPTTVTVQKYSGTKAPEVDTTGMSSPGRRGSGYWKVAVDQQPTSAFDVKVYFGDEELGNITDPANNLILAKYDPNTNTWTPFPRTTDAGANWASYVDWANRTVTVKGLTDFGGTSLYSDFILTDRTDPVSKMRLDLTVLIQGLYDGTTMVSDVLNLEIRSEASPYTIVDQSTVTLSTTGEAVFYSYKARPTNYTGTAVKYWIVPKHLSSVETWSAAAEPFSNVTGVLAYNFTTAANKAYGDNQILIGTKYCIYTGDINGDGTVDLNDAIPILSDYDNLDYHLANDLNLDGTIDLNDAIPVLSGYDNLVGAVIPAKLMSSKTLKNQIDRRSMLEMIEKIRGKQQQQQKISK